MFYVESLGDDSSIQTLTQAIFKYGLTVFKDGKDKSDLIRITKSELAFLAIGHVRNYLDKLTPQTLDCIDKIVDELYFTKTEQDGQQVVMLKELSMSQNAYLLEAYKSTFLPDNMVQSLSHFFNERPAESSPAMYKLLILTLTSPALSLENYKTLLSELTEVLPCILR